MDSAAANLVAVGAGRTSENPDADYACCSRSDNHSPTETRQGIVFMNNKLPVPSSSTEAPPANHHAEWTERHTKRGHVIAMTSDSYYECDCGSTFWKGKPVAAPVVPPAHQLFIDLDGVLADFDAYYEQQFGVKLDRGLPNDPSGMWDNITGHGSFYASLPLMPDALELWEGAKRLHPNPIILTGCPYSVPDVERHKREWVARHIAADAMVITCKSKDKRLHGKPGDVLVDDWHKYRPLWEEMGGVFVLHTSAADSLAKVSKLLRAASVATDPADK